jgi:hypothetical protein
MIALRLDVFLTDAQLDRLAATELRSDPRKPWTPREQKECARKALLRIIKVAVAEKAERERPAYAPSDDYLDGYPAAARATADRAYTDGFEDGVNASRGQAR